MNSWNRRWSGFPNSTTGCIADSSTGPRAHPRCIEHPCFQLARPPAGSVRLAEIILHPLLRARLAELERRRNLDMGERCTNGIEGLEIGVGIVFVRDDVERHGHILAVGPHH